MNTTRTTAQAAKANTAATTLPKSGKPQLGMAPPRMERAAAVSPRTGNLPTSATAAVRGTKTAAVIALLDRDSGATLAELVAATGWLSHTMRAALTGLRKKGHVIERSKRDDKTRYRIVAGAPDAAEPA